MDDHLDLDLGFDSLKRVEFQAVLESRLGPVPAKFMGEVVTVRDVIEKLMALKNDHAETTEATMSWHEIVEAPLPSDLTKRFLTPPSWGNQLIGNIAMACFEGLFRVAFSLTVKGLEHLPREGPSILAANHLSFIDPFIILAAVPRATFSQLYTLGWEPYFRSPFRLWVAGVGHMIPVGPDMPMLTVIQTSAALLRSGKSLLIFPEGERSIEWQLLPFKKGVGVLACELNAPVIPVKIESSYQAWSPDTHRPHFHPITLTFGKGQIITPSMIKNWKTKGENPHVLATLS